MPAAEPPSRASTHPTSTSSLRRNPRSLRLLRCAMTSAESVRRTARATCARYSTARHAGGGAPEATRKPLSTPDVDAHAVRPTCSPPGRFAQAFPGVMDAAAHDFRRAVPGTRPVSSAASSTASEARAAQRRTPSMHVRHARRPARESAAARHVGVAATLTLRVVVELCLPGALPPLPGVGDLNPHANITHPQSTRERCTGSMRFGGDVYGAEVQLSARL